MALQALALRLSDGLAHSDTGHGASVVTPSQKNSVVVLENKNTNEDKVRSLECSLRSAPRWQSVWSPPQRVTLAHSFAKLLRRNLVLNRPFANLSILQF